MEASARSWCFWIDTGGTFTDCLGRDPEGRLSRLKVLSTGAVRARILRCDGDRVAELAGLPTVPPDFFRGFLMRQVTGGICGRIERWDPATRRARWEEPMTAPLEDGAVLDLTAEEEAPVLGMRLLTGTPLAEPLPPLELRLATTRGTNALLEGKGARVAFFVTAGLGDLLCIGDQRRPELFALNVRRPAPLHGPVIEVPERLAADGSVLRALDLAELETALFALREEGITSAAVALMHSYRNAQHEEALAELLRARGFAYVSVSSALVPLIKLVPRAETTVVDAVLAPVMERYLRGVERSVAPEKFSVMTSAGGLVHRSRYRPKDSLLSGPAGGVTGAEHIARLAGIERVITFDMGGTSTDVARLDGGLSFRYQHAVGSARVCAPAVQVETVAAGGGSICRFDGAALVVGPESAGAAPGPACYGGGGPLTLTDINLLLGRLDPARFGVPVFPARSRERLREVRAAVAAQAGKAADEATILQGFLDIADERMAEAIQRLSVREGYDPAEYTLVAFGGAGGLHACAVADRLGIKRILFPADSGLLSAFGLRAAVPQAFAERQILRPLTDVAPELPALLAELVEMARDRLHHEGVAADEMEQDRAELELRLTGQESTLTIPWAPPAELESRFLQQYRVRYGYAPTAGELEVVLARVLVVARRASEAAENFPAAGARPDATGTQGPTLGRDTLQPGDVFQGPAIVQDSFSTLAVATDWKVRIGSGRSILLDRLSGAGAMVQRRRPDVVALELFTCRFLALVDEMGALLQRCARSVNVKERLDFSCALLDPDGRLVANAPHIPVHLGAMGLCVRRLRDTVAMEPGDVVVTNHPKYGGSHLPDVTLVAPVHAADGTLLGYVANRAHHAELGGTRPGSMPPDARCLADEGVVIAPFHLVRGGNDADWPGMRAILSGGPHPSRAVEENVADLHAQLAAIRRGADALRELGAQSGPATVLRFMVQLRDRAAVILAEALARLPRQRWTARDTLDDGTPIAVAIERDGPRLRIDFAGTGDVHPGNLNATPAIVHSAVIYVLRLLAGADLPLNDGLMRDVELVIPRGLLAPEFGDDPRYSPAVVGGNVETSQRVVDVLLKAFGLAACSQGTMNNVILGNDRFSYYETIGGGTGGGPGFAGCDAIHSHMTNTAITDPEILEQRLPLRLERFAIRRGSAGAGAFPGGCGIDRRIRALEPLSLSLLTQRRLLGPPGAAGGDAGQPGEQWIERADGRRERLDGAAEAELDPGDLLVIRTPGGGGWSQRPTS